MLPTSEDQWTIKKTSDRERTHSLLIANALEKLLEIRAWVIAREEGANISKSQLRQGNSKNRITEGGKSKHVNKREHVGMKRGWLTEGK